MGDAAESDDLALRRKRRLIAEYLDLTGLGDAVLPAAKRNALLKRISEEYDKHPDRFRNVKEMLRMAMRHEDFV